MENELDLTLRLGLPKPTVDTTLSLNSCNTTDQGSNIVNNGYGANTNNGGGEVFNLGRAIWGDDEVMINKSATKNNNTRVYNSLSHHQFAGASNTLNFNPYVMPPTQAPAPEAPPASSGDSVLIDVPARRAHRNYIRAMTNALNGQRLRGYNAFSGPNNEVTKQCSNRNCNAVVTPLWRRGPLGLKTLCNACGIKFKKEETRKAQREAVIINDN